MHWICLKQSGLAWSFTYFCRPFWLYRLFSIQHQTSSAGQERFRTSTSSYYRGAHGIILGTISSCFSSSYFSLYICCQQILAVNHNCNRKIGLKRHSILLLCSIFCWVKTRYYHYGDYFTCKTNSFQCINVCISLTFCSKPFMNEEYNTSAF